MRLVILDTKLWFPSPQRAMADGLLAVGGDLSVERLLLAYRSGVFPWTSDPITWWSPDPRAIFELDAFHATASLRKLVRQRRFRVTIDQAFTDVMLGCAEITTHRPSSWVTPAFVRAYTELHRAGHAHSVECWQDGELAGGIYGVHVGSLFAGESMFHRASNASKVALFHLVEALRQCRFKLFDTQMVTPATVSLGAREIPRREYLARLEEAVATPCQFPPSGEVG